MGIFEKMFGRGGAKGAASDAASRTEAGLQKVAGWAAKKVQEKYADFKENRALEAEYKRQYKQQLKAERFRHIPDRAKIDYEARLRRYKESLKAPKVKPPARRVQKPFVDFGSLDMGIMGIDRGLNIDLGVKPKRKK